MKTIKDFRELAASLDDPGILVEFADLLSTAAWVRDDKYSEAAHLSLALAIDAACAKLGVSP